MHMLMFRRLFGYVPLKVHHVYLHVICWANIIYWLCLYNIATSTIVQDTSSREKEKTLMAQPGIIGNNSHRFIYVSLPMIASS